VQVGTELVDWVALDDTVIEPVTRARMRAERLRHRAVFVVVRSSRGDVLVHRRSDAKDLWPGRWDIAVGGVVSSGEAYDVAARRELAEEVGVRAAVGDGLTPLGAGVYADPDVDLVARLYTVVSDGPFAFADGEVVEARFVRPDELRTWAGTVPLVPDSWDLLAPLILGPVPPAT
jgi:8-oxo-dGTP pyrophosphatase MutT (NUDIX family)